MLIKADIFTCYGHRSFWLVGVSVMLMPIAFMLGPEAAGWTNRFVKVPRAIADLGEDSLSVKHLSEAVQYRTLDRNLWV